MKCYLKKYKKKGIHDEIINLSWELILILNLMI